MVKIIAIIPARSGSKRIKDKNIKKYKGIPLISHSIKHSLKSKYIQRTIVSTDSEKYAKIAPATDNRAKIFSLSMRFS